VESSDVVVMLAAIMPGRGRNSEVLIKNLVMMRNLLKALEKSNCSHLIHISSDAVYNNEIHFVQNEERTAPQGLYGVMHLARELMLKDFTKLPTLILRPTLVYGYGDTHDAYGLNRFIRTANDMGEIFIFGSGEEMRDHIYVECVADFIMRCIRFKTTGVSFLASGVSKSFYDLAISVTHQFERKIEIVSVGRKNPITHRQYDNSHLLKAFPDFNFILPEDGIIKVLTEMNLGTNSIGDTNLRC
jgi:nucleoside-diphosphate-sugar epimerase